MLIKTVNCTEIVQCFPGYYLKEENVLVSVEQFI